MSQKEFTIQSALPKEIISNTQSNTIDPVFDMGTSNSQTLIRRNVISLKLIVSLFRGTGIYRNLCVLGMWIQAVHLYWLQRIEKLNNEWLRNYVEKLGD